MSVLIRGMKIPGVCYECYFCTYGFCAHLERYVTAIQERDADCPLIELPPHGRLIDADELVLRWTAPPDYYPDDYSKSVYDNGKLSVKDFRASVTDAPTIIPAEEGE